LTRYIDKETPMNKILMAGIALAAACGAQAQSSVTVFGVADLAVRRVDNEGRGGVSSIVSGSNSTSRLGFRGSEDLGGGLFAGFHLEHGIAMDLGSQATAVLFFDRRSTVSLGSRSLGEVRIGRDFIPSYNNWGRYDPFSYVGAASASNFISATPVGPIRSAFGSGLASTVRSSNAVQWILPSGWGGVNGELMWAKREGGTAANGQHDVRGGRVGWAAGGIDISAAMTVSSNDLTTAIGSDFKDLALAGRVDLGAVRVALGVRRFTQADARQTNLLLGLWVPVGNGEIKLSVNQANLAGRVGAALIDANDARQVGLGYVHGLSKRSAVYATLSRVDNRGAATFAVPGGPTGLAGGGHSTGLEFGVRHNF
jgi:predicted porin